MSLCGIVKETVSDEAAKQARLSVRYSLPGERTCNIHHLHFRRCQQFYPCPYMQVIVYRCSSQITPLACPVQLCLVASLHTCCGWEKVLWWHSRVCTSVHANFSMSSSVCASLNNSCTSLLPCRGATSRQCTHLKLILPASHIDLAAELTPFAALTSCVKTHAMPILRNSASPQLCKHIRAPDANALLPTAPRQLPRHYLCAA